MANLRAALREAENLPAQLAALFGFLTDIRAYERSLQKQEEFKALDLRREAGEQAQVWNRILGTLDQMHAILGAVSYTHLLGFSWKRKNPAEI